MVITKTILKIKTKPLPKALRLTLDGINVKRKEMFFKEH